MANQDRVYSSLVRVALYPVYFVTKYLGATAAGISQVVVHSKPMRVLAEKIRPDIEQPAFVPARERFSIGVNSVLEALAGF